PGGLGGQQDARLLAGLALQAVGSTHRQEARGDGPGAQDPATVPPRPQPPGTLQRANRPGRVRGATGIFRVASQNMARGHALAQTSEFALQVARQKLAIYRAVPEGALPPEELDMELKAWQSWGQEAEKVDSVEPVINLYTASTSGVVNTALSVASSIAW